MNAKAAEKDFFLYKHEFETNKERKQVIHFPRRLLYHQFLTCNTGGNNLKFLIFLGVEDNLERTFYVSLVLSRTENGSP